MFIWELSTSQGKENTTLWIFKCLFLPWLKLIRIPWKQSFKWNPFFTFTWSTPMTESIPLTSPSDLLEHFLNTILNLLWIEYRWLDSEKFYRHIILLYTSPGHIGSYFLSWGLFLIISCNCKCLIFLLVHCMPWWVLLC